MVKKLVLTLALPAALLFGGAAPASASVPQDCYDLAYGIVYNASQGNVQYAAFLLGLFQNLNC